LFKGSNDFQGKLQLPNIKGGINLQKEDTILQYQERVDLVDSGWLSLMSTLEENPVA
jgi:hypothetical protein